MAYYDQYGHPIAYPGGGRPGARRARHHVEYDDYWDVPEPSGRQPRQPAQIIINNDNHVDDYPDYYASPPHRPQRVYVQDQQVVQVSRPPPPQSDISYSTRRDLDELERMRREKEADDLKKKIKKDLELEAAKKHEEELREAEERKELKKKAIEEWKAEEDKKKREAKEKEEEREKIGKEYMRQQLRKEGWSDEEIDIHFKGRDKQRASSPSASSTTVVIRNRKQPIYLKVHKKHIDPQTLDAYSIEWEWADSSHEYIHIYRELPQSDQEILFEHTRKLKERKLIQFAEVETVVTSKVDRDRQGRLVVVRKKDRARSKSPAVVKKKFFI